MTAGGGSGGRTAHHNAPPVLDTSFIAHGACMSELALLPEPTDVMCADSGPDAKTAKSICSRCRVELECLSWAIEVGQEGCTHGRIRFTPRYLNRFRRTMSLISEETVVTIRTTAPTALGRPGTVAAIPTHLAAAFVAAKYATLETP